jgi:two-component system sensor histidine kinase BaeS
MRARITLAFVITLAITLLVASAASLLLVRHASSINAQKTLLSQARIIQEHPNLVLDPGILPLIRSDADIKDEKIIVFNAKGKLIDTPPPDLPASILDGPLLVKGKDIVGAHNHIAFVAAPLLNDTFPGSGPGETVVLVLESKESFSVANVLYFAIAGLISLIVAAGFSFEISRRITRHVKAAVEAARQIATGDFSARMDVPGRGYPELLVLQDSLNRMAYDLERSREAERDFLLSVSHELRTPLTSIRGYAEAIAEGAVADPADAGRVVVNESNRLARLIEDLLSMARLTANQFTFRIERCDLAATAVGAAEALRYAFNDAGIKLDVSATVVGFYGTTDADRLTQIISNLVENALKYAAHQVDVKISDVEGTEFVVEIGDDGPGIDPEDQLRVFERLFTSDRHSSRRVGTGLGLAIVAEFTQALGGSIAVSSPRDEHGGTIFRLRIPRETQSTNRVL